MHLYIDLFVQNGVILVLFLFKVASQGIAVCHLEKTPIRVLLSGHNSIKNQFCL